MSRIAIWYGGLGRRAKTAVICVAVIAVLAVIGSIGYMLFYPEKVQVRYGTIVRDPVDGHVWEDNTRTAMVPPSQAGSYRVEYIDKLSPEHEQQAAEEQAELARQEAARQNPSGFTSLQAPVDARTMRDMETLQQNIETAGSNLVSGMEMAAEISRTKSSLVQYRNDLAGTAVPPELEQLKRQGLQIFDKYIRGCDLYLQGIATSSMVTLKEAGNLINEANDMVRGMIPSF